MTPLDSLLQAQTTDDQKKALKKWTSLHGPVFEFMLTLSQPGIAASLVPPERFAELLDAYQRSRRYYLIQIKKNLGSFTESDFEYHMLLYSLAEHLEGDLEPVRPVMEKMLLNRDTEMMGVATKLFEQMGPQSWSSWPVIRQAFARHGTWERPFHLGKAVAAAVSDEPARLESLRSALREGNDKEQQALCQVLVELGPVAAPLADTVLEVANSKDADPETVSCVIMALGYLNVINAGITSLILQSIESEHWFLRSNAIATAGLLRLEPATCIPLITNHLRDDYGYDGWSASVAAVKALGQYGPAAHQAATTLAEMLKTTEDEEVKNTVTEALALIRGKRGSS